MTVIRNLVGGICINEVHSSQDVCKETLTTSWLKIRCHSHSIFCTQDIQNNNFCLSVMTLVHVIGSVHKITSRLKVFNPGKTQRFATVVCFKMFLHVPLTSY